MPENQFSQPLLKLIDLNALDVFSGMALAFVLSAILSRVLMHAARNTATDSAHYRTMILLATVVSLIMAVIGNSLARAFGAIGALSLIRFRTAVKSSNELAYLFMAISVGMACGSGYFAIATGATGLFIVFSVIIERFFCDSRQQRLSMLKIAYPSQTDLNQKIIETIKKQCRGYQILSQQNLGGSRAEIFLEAAFVSEVESAELIKSLQQLSDEISLQIVLDQAE